MQSRLARDSVEYDLGEPLESLLHVVESALLCSGAFESGPSNAGTMTSGRSPLPRRLATVLERESATLVLLI